MSAPSPVWLIHGWAANRRVFDPLAQRLPGHTVHTPELPGHGNAPFDGHFNITATADAWAEHLAEPVHLLGWSLGGAVALTLAARHPGKVRSLCLTAAFAKLQAEPDYPEGLRQIALHKMLPLFAQDYPKYMRQFLQLQFLHAPNCRGLLQHALETVPTPGAPPALAEALAAAERFDGRPLLSAVRCPVLLVFGSKDAITPPRMGAYLQEHLPGSRLHLIDGAAHAPFLSHADPFAALYRPFLQTA